MEQQVTQIVYSMIQMYGMNDRIGNLAFPKQVRLLSVFSSGFRPCLVSVPSHPTACPGCVRALGLVSPQHHHHHFVT